MLIRAILGLSHTIEHQKLLKNAYEEVIRIYETIRKNTHYAGHYQSNPPGISIYSTKTLVNQ